MREHEQSAAAARPYSRLETDEELLARMKGARPNGSETLDDAAWRHAIQRRIIWVYPGEKR